MSGDTFGAEELELRRDAEHSAPAAGQSSEESVDTLALELRTVKEECDKLARAYAEQATLARAYAEQATLVQSWAARQQRDFDALDAAGIHMLRGGSEEVSDGICRLAGERDQFKSLLLSIARGIGMQPDEHSGFLRVVQCALHLAAKAGEQVRTLAEQDARLGALEHLLAQKNAQIAALECDQDASRRACDDALETIAGALERLRAA